MAETDETLMKAILEESGYNPAAPEDYAKLRISLHLEFAKKFLRREPSSSASKTFVGSAARYQKPDPSQPEHDPLFRPVPHSSSLQHACGTAVYVDDMPPFREELQLVIVQGRRAHAKIKAINYER